MVPFWCLRGASVCAHAVPLLLPLCFHCIPMARTSFSRHGCYRDASVCPHDASMVSPWPCDGSAVVLFWGNRGYMGARVVSVVVPRRFGGAFMLSQWGGQ